MKRAVVGLMVLLFAVAGCGSSSPKTEKPKTYKNAAAVAEAAHLQDCSDSTPSQVKNWATQVTCGERAIVVNFVSDTDKGTFVDNWLANSQSGDSAVLVGQRWAINCPERNTCTNLRAIIGGVIKP